jgi:hypothetical protein
MKATSQVAFIRMPKIQIRSYRISLAIMSHDNFAPDLGFIICHRDAPADVKRQRHNVNSVSESLSSEKDWHWTANDN